MTSDITNRKDDMDNHEPIKSDYILSSIYSHIPSIRKQLIIKHEDAHRSILAMKSDLRGVWISPEILAKIWRISLDTVKYMSAATTQLNLRQPVHSINRRFRTDLSTLKYKRLEGRWYSDTIFSKTRSLSGDTCAQISNCKFFIKVIPIKSEKEAANALKTFNEDVGVPNHLAIDGGKAQAASNNEFRKQCSFTNTCVHTIEPYTPNKNFAETMIGWLKKR